MTMQMPSAPLPSGSLSPKSYSEEEIEKEAIRLQKVINQGTGRRFACQFMYTCDGKLETVHERKPHDMALKIAKILLTTHDRKLTKGSTHYHSNYVNPQWSKKFQRVARFGRHIFYKQPLLVSQR